PLIRPSCRYAQIRRYAPERPACSFFLFTLRQPPTPTLFPYTTLFRSEALGHRHAAGMASLDLADRLVRSPQRTLLGEDGLALLRSEEHTSELQSPYDLVCRLLLEKKKNNIMSVLE